MPGPTTHPESKNYWFRMAVPERLRSKIGKREIKFSLSDVGSGRGEGTAGA
ncbi:MAG TPA: DUF6538 domain-containing protein [Allosphingosinicella sp.]|nr:DUF6538 domain-containing protein [Allosphingosinicella sp.]